MESGEDKFRARWIQDRPIGFKAEIQNGQDSAEVRRISLELLQAANNTFQKKDEKSGLTMVKLAREIMQGPADGPEARLLCLLYRWIGDRLVIVGKGREAMDFHRLYELFHRQDVTQWPWFKPSPRGKGESSAPPALGSDETA